MNRLALLAALVLALVVACNTNPSPTPPAPPNPPASPSPNPPPTPPSPPATPTLVSSTPADGATKVKLDSGLVLNFNLPIKQDSLTLTCNVTLPAPRPEDPCVSALRSLGQAIWSDGGKTATFTPNEPLFLHDSFYTFTLKASDLTGKALPDGTHVGFRIIPFPPRFLPTEPTFEKTVRDFRLKFLFSKPMDRASVEAAFTVKNSQTNVPVKAAWSPDDMEVTISPVSLVPYSTVLSWVFQGRVQSADGGEATLDEGARFVISSFDQILLTSDPAGDGFTTTVMDGSKIISRAFDRTSVLLFVGDDSGNAKFTQGYLTFKLPKGAIPDNVIINGSNLRLTQADAPFGNSTDDFGPINLYSVAFTPPLTFAADFPNPDPWNGSSDPFASVIRISPNSSATTTIRGMDPALIQWQWDHRLESNRQDALNYDFQYRLSYVTKTRLTPISVDGQTDAISFATSEDPDPNRRPQLQIFYRISDSVRQ